MREAIAFLKENSKKWKDRRNEESIRIREEEKRDRLAVVKEKKKRYGIKKINKEENMRLKMRTEERLLISKAKENLWKRHRGGREEEEEEKKAWQMIEDCVKELEEDGRDIQNKNEENSTRTVPKIKKSVLESVQERDWSGGREGGQAQGVHGDLQGGGDDDGRGGGHVHHVHAVPTEGHGLQGGRDGEGGGPVQALPVPAVPTDLHHQQDLRCMNSM